MKAKREVITDVQFRDEFYSINDSTQNIEKIEYCYRDIDDVITQQKCVKVYLDKGKAITFPLEQTVVYGLETEDES